MTAGQAESVQSFRSSPRPTRRMTASPRPLEEFEPGFAPGAAHRELASRVKLGDVNRGDTARGASR